MVDDVHYIRGIPLFTMLPMGYRTHEPPYDADDVTLHAHCIFVEGRLYLDMDVGEKGWGG